MKNPASLTLFLTSEVCVYGKEFKVKRRQRGISLVAVSNYMNQRGWCYYPSKIFRYEQRMKFCLPAQEMTDLIDAIGIESKIMR